MLAIGAAASGLSTAVPAAGHSVESESSEGPGAEQLGRWRQSSGSEGPAPAPAPAPPPPPAPAPAPAYPPPPPAGTELGPGGMYPGVTTPAPAPVPTPPGPPVAPAPPFSGKGDGPDTGHTGS
ncbi:hypothetical protein [Nocardia mexicana]|uniref:hypothetical protein n=1 Tax=Nocardia mexicana TaxID=279262 RepID=UPI0012F49CAD|nr:hypothetical protein [Nocardia mexicana]